MWVAIRGRRRRRRRVLHTRSRDMYTETISSTFDQPCIMKKHNTNTKYWMIIASGVIFAFVAPATCTVMLPVWETQIISSGTGRNIRHLPCVSRRTGETGLCMFAYSCAKANGTHLGTCIDRFYFGSCCKTSANTDVDLIEPITSNHIGNKNDVNVMSTTIKMPHERPSSILPEFSTDTVSSSVPGSSMSTMSRPMSVSLSSSSSISDFISTLVKTSSYKPTTGHVDSSSITYDNVPLASRTPSINLTFSQSYTTPVTTVTTSPFIYSSSVTASFPAATHKPPPVYSTTAYSKPLSKPTSKPTKPKPQTSSSKPISIKPKPTKNPSKPSLSTVSDVPSLYTTPSYTQTTTSVTNTYVNRTTVHHHSSYTGSTKPSFTDSDTTFTTKVPMLLSSSTQGIPTPITHFTSHKKPTKPAKPFTSSPIPSSTSSYVKIPVSTVQQTKPNIITNAYTNFTETSTTEHSTDSSSFSNTYSISSTTPSEFSSSSKYNYTLNENEIEYTEKPSTQYWSSTTTEKSPTRPWPTQQSTVSVTNFTTSQQSFITWTTIDEIPAVILPDRTKPTSIIRPSGKPPTTKPTQFFRPTSTYLSSTSDRPTLKPSVSTMDIEESTRPYTTLTSNSNSSTSSAWVEVSVTTHAPTVPQTTGSTDGTPTEVTSVTTTIAHGTTKPSTTFTIPVASPLPIETTPSSLDSNEIESSSLNMSNYKEVCGRRLFPSARIVGGEKAAFGKWPWQISLRQWRTSTYLHKCGAALFNENWAVTAAHCVENVPPSDLLLRLGEHDLSVEDEPYGYQERRVQIVASHPQFDPRTFEYDLALLRFYEPVKFQPNIIPICVPDDDTNFVGSSAYVTGWGRLYEDGPLPSVLQEVSVPVINNTVCESMYQAAGYIEHIPNIFICAGWRKGGFDSCEGDSGGPMVIQRTDKRWLLAGIISWGIGCAEPNQPGVYTRISEFRDWINQILQF